MKTLIKITFFGFWLFAGKTAAQNKIIPLKVGDTVPELILNGLIGHDQPVKLSSLHQQDLLIINFWATWCSPCVKELPVLDSLVKNNTGKVKVLSVAYERRATVNAFLKRRSGLNTSHLLIATDDQVLIEYFKHEVIPHNVWINKAGVVVHITGGDEINQKNVSAFLTRSAMELHEKNDLVNFDGWKPFHLRDSDFNYRSIETAFIDGINTGITCQGVWGHPTEKWVIRLFGYNLSREQLFWTAVSQFRSSYNHYGIMKIETGDSLRFYWPEQCRKTFAASNYKSRTDWEKENTFCYELSLPNAVNDSTFYANMMNDLERIFPVKVTTENRRMPVCVLTLQRGRSFTAPRIDSTYIDVDHDHIRAHNVPLIRLCEYLNEKIKKDPNVKSDDPPYVDETGIKTRVDIDISFGQKVYTYLQLKKYLEDQYGIHFHIEDRDYPVTVIKDLAP